MYHENMNHDSFTYESLKSFLHQNNFFVDEKVLKIIFTYITSLPRIGGMLLRGPPGAGKTTMVELLAKYLDAKLVYYQATVGTAEDDCYTDLYPVKEQKAVSKSPWAPCPGLCYLAEGGV